MSLLSVFTPRSSDTNVTEDLGESERIELLKYLAEKCGGMQGPPATYSVHSGIGLTEDQKEDPDNYVILFSSTAELRPGIFVPAYSWAASDDKVPRWYYEHFKKDVKYILETNDHSSDVENVLRFKGLYYNELDDNKVRYDNTADLFSKMSEAGFSDIASTLCVDPEQQTSKEPVPLSMNPGGRLIKDTFWRVPISSHVSGIIGYYALIDKETESLL